MKKFLLTLAACAGLTLSAGAAVVYEGLAANADGWTFENTNIPEGLTYVWQWKETQYGNYLNGSAYNQQAYAAEAWAVSPTIDLSEVKEANVTFEHAAKFQTTLLTDCGLYVREDKGEWTKLTIPTWPEAGSWTFVSAGDIKLDAYAGKKIQLGFKYVSTDKGADTWEIKNFQVYSGNAEKPDTPDTPVTSEKGTLDNPLTIDQLLAIDCPAKDSGEKGWFVKGYIVGYVPGMNMSETVFGPAAADAQNTNIVLGGSSAEDEIDACLPVQLPKGDIRDALNLVANPGNLGKCVILEGTYEKYFGVSGLKSVVSYKFVDGNEPDPTPVTPPTSDAIYEGLVDNADDFTFDGTAEYPEGYEYKVWSWDAKYGLVASAYDSATSSSFVSDMWAVSPKISLKDVKDANMTLSQAANKFKDNADFLANTSVNVREVGGEWTKLNITTLPEGSTDWTFVDSEEISLKEFAGKEIEIGFRYVSTANGGGKWEIKNLKVTGAGDSAVAEFETEEVEAIYFNLQGVRVMNPENGLYIERRGNKARKVVIR